jgi:hypothetical protein
MQRAAGPGARGLGGSAPGREGHRTHALPRAIGDARYGQGVSAWRRRGGPGRPRQWRACVTQDADEDARAEGCSARRQQRVVGRGRRRAPPCRSAGAVSCVARGGATRRRRRPSWPAGAATAAPWPPRSRATRGALAPPRRPGRGGRGPGPAHGAARRGAGPPRAPRRHALAAVAAAGGGGGTGQGRLALGPAATALTPASRRARGPTGLCAVGETLPRDAPAGAPRAGAHPG